MYAEAKRTHLQLAYTAKQLKASQHGSLICAVCLVYYHSLLKVQTDSQVSLYSEVLLKFVISGVWCLQCRCQVWSGAIKTVSCSIFRFTEHQLLHIVRLREFADQGAEMGLSAPVVFLVKTSVTFSTLTSCTRVLSWPLWTFPICFCCKTHIYTISKLILLLLSIV